MRIAILKSRLDYKGGLEKYTLKLAEAFAEKGLSITLLTTGTPPKLPYEVVSLAPTSKLSYLHLTRFDALCQKWLASHSYEIVFGMERTTCQTHYRAGSGVHAAYLKQRKLTDSLFKRLTFSINPLHRALLQMEKKTFENPSLRLIFANSEMVRREILETYCTPPEKIVVVHNGVEWQQWETNFKESFSKNKNSYYHFLFVGNGYNRKGLPFLLKGFSHLPKGEWKLTVVGKEKNCAHFQKQARHLGLDNHIYFAGPQSNLCPFYQAADCLVIPSIYDPFANVTLEALSMGLFVVSSRFNGGHEVLTDRMGCVIEDLTSAESVASALAKAIKNPKTIDQASFIRNQIKELDFSKQLDKIVSTTLK